MEFLPKDSLELERKVQRQVCKVVMTKFEVDSVDSLQTNNLIEKMLS